MTDVQSGGSGKVVRMPSRLDAFLGKDRSGMSQAVSGQYACCYSVCLFCLRVTVGACHFASPNDSPAN